MLKHAPGPRAKKRRRISSGNRKTRHPQVIKIAKMAKNGQNVTKRNHRAHKMADFTENCVYFGAKDGAIAP